ncbi:Trm112 family protein [Neisseria meningitidis]|nr:Trm112 family protein [Neisseria meningitidis]MBJ7873787.1 Trm112 family protein [Neisseria meningitidis]
MNHQTRKQPYGKKFLDILVCPVTKGRLEYHQDKQELWSRQAKLAYPIKDGIPYMLENEARPLGEEELEA